MLLHVGRLAAEKNLDLLAQAWSPMVLGLHYLSDVLVGAAIGLLPARLTLSLL